MKILLPSLLRPSAALAGVLATAFLGSIQAAPLVISDATYGGSVTPGTPENITGVATLTGLTTAEGTFTNLTGATASGITSTVLPSSVGTTPPNDQAGRNLAASGLTANDAVQNLGEGYFQFNLGSSFDDATRFFIFDTTPVGSTAGDATTVTLVNSLNVVVGSFSLSLVASDFTNTPANTTNTSLATLTYTQNPNANYASKLGGVMFSLADMGVDTPAEIASVNSATGLRLVSANLDPSMVGVVPEPQTATLLALGLAILAGRRRKRKRAFSGC